MNVAMLLGSFPSLTETWILDQIVALRSKGVRLTIMAAPPADPNTPRHHIVDEHRLLDLVRHQPPRPSTRLGRLASAPTVAFSNLTVAPKAMLGTLNVARYGWRSLSGDITRMAAIAIPEIRRGGFDLIHCHDAQIGMCMAAIKRLAGIKVPMLVSVHGPDVLDRANILRNNGYREMIAVSNGFTVGSRYVQDRVLRLGFDSRQTHIIPQGVVCSRWAFKERRPDADGTVRVLAIARLTEFKGIEFGIRAMAEVCKEHSRAHLQIVGDGPLRAGLKALVHDLGVGKNVHFLGMLTRDQLMPVIDAAHVFMHPGIETASGLAEGQGVVLQEAQACGLPVVCTSAGGIPESVLGGKSAIVTEPRSPESLVRALRLLLSAYETWPSMGHAGRAFVESAFDLDTLVVRLLSLYAQTASAAAVRP